MNPAKFERFILKRMNEDVPMSWQVLVEQIEDQGPSKEWGPYATANKLLARTKFLLVKL